MATLRQIVDLLGPGLVSVVADPGSGLDGVVTDIAIVDPANTSGVGGGSLAVLIGVPDDQLESTIRECATRQAAGVVLRDQAARLEPATVLPVLAANAAVHWGHLLDLLSSALSASRPGGSAAVGDLFTLANAIAASVGGAVAIEDPRQRVVAYSSLPDQVIDSTRQRGILDRQVPSVPIAEAFYVELHRSAGVLHLAEADGRLGRRAIAVRAGAEVLGSIWVVDAGTLGSEADRLLEEAARAAAVQLLRARAAMDAQRIVHSDALLAVLDGRSPPEVAASRLDLQLDRPCCVLAVEIGASPDTPLQLVTERIENLFMFQAAARRWPVAATSSGRIVYALVSEATDRRGLRELAQFVLSHSGGPSHVELRATVGSLQAGLAGASRSRADADRALAVLSRMPAPSLATFDEVREQALLMDLRQRLEAEPSLELPAVRRMLDYDLEHGTPYAESVLAYLRAFGRIPDASQAVQLHPNSFRYRLRRIRELFEIDLEQPDTRLVVWLQLRLLLG